MIWNFDLWIESSEDLYAFPFQIDYRELVASGLALALSSDTVLALNFPSGAHHSELNEVRKDQTENDDIVEGRLQIADILGRWIAEVKNTNWESVKETFEK